MIKIVIKFSAAKLRLDKVSFEGKGNKLCVVDNQQVTYLRVHEPYAPTHV